MKKIIGLTIAIVLGVGMIGMGTFAYLIDTETSTGNQFTAGTLDLKTNDVDGVSQTLYAINMAPGDVEGPSTIMLNNSGSVSGNSLDIVFFYVENDGSPNFDAISADDTAAMIEVTVLDYGTDILLSSSIDDSGNSNGHIDLYDLTQFDFSGLSGIDAFGTKEFRIAVQLRSETPNEYQADGITLTMTFVLNQ